MVRVTPLFSFYRGNLTVLCSYLCIINECTSIFEDLSGFHDAASQEEESRCRRIMCPQEYVSGGHIGLGYSVLPDKFT